MKSVTLIVTRIARCAAAAALVLCSVAAQAQSADVESVAPELDNAPSAGAMAFDLILIRPLSLVATVLGSGIFLLQLPLALVQNRPPSDAAKKLVIEPARYTFDRPLGQTDP